MEEEKIEVKPVSEPSPETPIAEPAPEGVKLEEKEKEAAVGEPAPKPAPQEKTIPYERFREVNEKAKALEEENKKLKESPISSEEELAKKYPDWDFLDDKQKDFIKRQENLEKDVREMKEERAWNKDLADALAQFPQLKGKEAEFKEFCYSEKNIGNKNLEVLAKAFIFDKGEPVEPEVPARKGLEKPVGGPKQVPSAEMTLEDITRLRETNPKLYIKMIRENRIKKVPEK